MPLEILIFVNISQIQINTSIWFVSSAFPICFKLFPVSDISSNHAILFDQVKQILILFPIDQTTEDPLPFSIELS